ncbi:MAG: hypothetical protein IT562_20845 [Alphaproteobacteria bacterium]|nr:hypothetical protein [Alphaproteobacteria bacterium]
MNIFVVGSCRVHRPLRWAQEHHLVSIANGHCHWFTHSARECLQYLDILDGREIPPEMFQLVVGTGNVKSDAPQLAFDLVSSAHDVSVVEISTHKRLRYRDWHLHLDQFRIVSRELGLHPDILSDRLKIPLDLRDGAFLREFAMPRFYRDLFLETTLSMQTDDELLLELVEIGERIPGPIVFVDHFNVPRDDGTRFPERDRLTRTLRRYAAASGDLVYETAPAIMKSGRTTALADLNHYANDFEPVVAAEILGVIGEMARCSGRQLAEVS